MTPRDHSLELSKARPVLWVYLCCLALWLLTIGTFWGPLRECLELALHDNRYSHLIVIPLISACLIYGNRSEIFRASAHELRVGIPLVLVAAVSGWWFWVRFVTDRYNYRLALAVLVFLFICSAGFLLCFGARALWTARFPLLFLVLMIPIPRVLMDKIILALQVGVSQTLYALFSLTGTALFKHDFTFELPGVALVIGEECTSIHAIWALFIVTLLVGHFFLRSFPAQACLCLVTLPISIFSSAMRVLTVWFLTFHVSSDFLSGNIHRHGGILFSLLSLCIVLLTLGMFRRSEGRLGLHRDSAEMEMSAEPTPQLSTQPSLAAATLNWGELSGHADLSCQLAFGTSVSYQRANRPAMTVVGVLADTRDAQRQSLRFFLRPADFPVSPDLDRLTIDGITYTVSAVQEGGKGKWLSLRSAV